ncbi:hypothetical protein UlMin_018930 [Ulmus minor]
MMKWRKMKIEIPTTPSYPDWSILTRTLPIQFFFCSLICLDRKGPDVKDQASTKKIKTAFEALRVLNLNNNKYFLGPYAFVHSFLVAREDVVFVANDWHTAILPCHLKSNYQPKGFYKKAKVAFCIHNIAYQGRFAFSDFSLLNLPDRFRSSFDFMDGFDKPVKGMKINWMKGGILESDKVVTVSPYYAQELISGEDRGVELANIIRKTGISGIVNGMDIQEISLVQIEFQVLEAKPLLKEALQAEVDLPIDKSIPLLYFIGRLEEQKGPEILAVAISKFIDEDVQIIVLESILPNGTGKKYLEKQLEQLEIKYPNKARGIAKFNIPLAHMIIVGSNFMVVPSRFEPCASTGGLVNTVKEEIVERALATYRTPALKEMIQNYMAQDLSWKEPSKLWEKLLLSLDVAGTEGINGEDIAPMAKENTATS